MSQVIRQRIAVSLLSLSAAGFATWQASEGYTPVAVIPTKGDVPTIGHGSTRYEDGSPVRMGDTITPARAEVLTRNLNGQAEQQFAASIPGVKLHQDEFDLYMDFIGQYGIGTWRKGSPRKSLLAGNYAQACNDLLKYRYAAGFDCSTPGNKRCAGVWARQLERHAKCMDAQ
ncbi:glycoside hydrolase family protein [Pseudomonas sp. MF5691]|uniref:glycoside hydrolase family protein n=1 Tax=Pseudomonas sp. MF5691 TaxID=2797526 RepID=UPI0018E7F638|nr:glycoside hydrolase family protein [Pseudomonas sp. MF5691]MBJ2290736.1 glycoside hydrolase family protein [Pseudomonas sp. MF5691]